MKEDALVWQALSKPAEESLEPYRVGSRGEQCLVTAGRERVPVVNLERLRKVTGEGLRQLSAKALTEAAAPGAARSATFVPVRRCLG